MKVSEISGQFFVKICFLSSGLLCALFVGKPKPWASFLCIKLEEKQWLEDRHVSPENECFPGIFAKRMSKKFGLK